MSVHTLPPRVAAHVVVWPFGPDPADTLPTARALSQAVESFSLNSAGVRAHVSRAAMLVEPELIEKHSRLALEYMAAADADLAVMRGLLNNHEPEEAA